MPLDGHLEPVGQPAGLGPIRGRKDDGETVPIVSAQDVARADMAREQMAKVGQSTGGKAPEITRFGG